MTRTTWWWVRHAPVTENRGRIYGASDPNADCDDAAAFAGLDRLLPADAAWVTSHLRRTHQTAEAIAAAGGRAIDPRHEPELGEQDFGDWQGQTYEEVWRGADAAALFAAAATTPAPGGESFADLAVRVARTIHRLNEELAGQDIVAVAHGGTIRAALALALDLHPEAALRFSVENLSLTRIDHYPAGDGLAEGWRVAWSNRMPR